MKEKNPKTDPRTDRMLGKIKMTGK